MNETSDFDETEIAVLLIGGKTDRDEGLRKLDEAYRMRVCACLRSHFPGMRPQDVAECYSDVLIHFMRILDAPASSTQSTSFNPDEPILPFLLTIARRRGVDWLRRARRHDEFIQYVGSSLGGTEAGVCWKGLEAVVRGEIRDEVRMAIAKLPSKERLVWSVFFEALEATGDRPSEQDLCELVRKKDGPNHTFISVKRALSNGRVSLRRHLETRGYQASEIFGDAS
ncbi:sigma-70 family RNA polymerase sigma factor [Isosphaeraceae bacterium EP7]